MLSHAFPMAQPFKKPQPGRAWLGERESWGADLVRNQENPQGRHLVDFTGFHLEIFLVIFGKKVDEIPRKICGFHGDMIQKNWKHNMVFTQRKPLGISVEFTRKKIGDFWMTQMTQICGLHREISP